MQCGLSNKAVSFDWMHVLDCIYKHNDEAKTSVEETANYLLYR